MNVDCPICASRVWQQVKGRPCQETACGTLVPRDVASSTRRGDRLTRSIRSRSSVGLERQGIPADQTVGQRLGRSVRPCPGPSQSRWVRYPVQKGCSWWLMGGGWPAEVSSWFNLLGNASAGTCGADHRTRRRKSAARCRAAGHRSRQRPWRSSQPWRSWHGLASCPPCVYN